MHSREKPIFFNYLHEQAERFDKNLSPEKDEIYWKYLNKYSFEEIQRAFEEHSKNDRYNPAWPTVTVLERLINISLSARGHNNLYSCQMHSFEGDHKACGKPAQTNVGGSEKPIFVCAAHYEAHREKSATDKEVDRRAHEFEKEAAALGMTNRQYFFHLRGRTAENANSKELQEIENRAAMAELFETYSQRCRERKDLRARFNDRGGGSA